MAIVSFDHRKVLDSWGSCCYIELPNGKELCWSPALPGIVFAVLAVGAIVLVSAAAVTGIDALGYAAMLLFSLFFVGIILGLLAAFVEISCR